MDENKEIQAEETTPNENIENNDTTSTENLSATPSAEDQLAEEKIVISVFMQSSKITKENQQRKDGLFKYANQDLMVSMLAVLDDFERAIKEISKNGNPDDLKGIELIYQKFKGKLTEKGLVTIEVQAGDSFDVDKHEAITQIPAPSDDLKGKIVDVIETGYMLHDKVIRFAKVVVGA